ncbi:MAG: catalase family protein [Gammaproteobacteria bacterium]
MRLICLALLLTSCVKNPSTFELAQEYPKADEGNIAQGLVHSLTRSLSDKYKNKTVLRDAHPKHHGCLRATVNVPELPAELAEGFFSQSGDYSAWIRYSTATDSVNHDKKKSMLGMAVKIMGVEGEPLSGNNTEGTQDILLLSHPVLPIRNAEDFLEVVDEKLWFFINPFDLHLHELRIALKSRKHHSSPLAIRYWSTTPYLFGEGRAIKYSAMPCSNTSQSLPETLAENYLRESMVQQLGNGDACFDLMVQFQTDANAMPIEDATIIWDEAVSPFRKVARIQIPEQRFDSSEQMEFCEDISMSPWHGLVDHRPLGSINRARKQVYQDLSEFRHRKNKMSP